MQVVLKETNVSYGKIIQILFLKKAVYEKSSPCSKYGYVTWSTTERRETRNFPHPFMFELTGPKG